MAPDTAPTGDQDRMTTTAAYRVRAQFACGHYRALTSKEAQEDWTQIGAKCFCAVCGTKHQVTRRETI